MLNNVHLVTADENTEKFLKARFIGRSDKSCQHEALHMYAKTAPTVLKNQTVQNNLSSEVYSVEANDKI